MKSQTMQNAMRVGIVSAVFAAGFLCGSVTQHSAEAEMGDIGGQIMNKAAGSGGMVGQAAQLGTAITDMEKQVSGLQKNLGILKNVKSSLMGGAK
jgi:hypothetical protein